jgi:hypothetical protein
MEDTRKAKIITNRMESKAKNPAKVTVKRRCVIIVASQDNSKPSVGVTAKVKVKIKARKQKGNATSVK